MLSSAVPSKISVPFAANGGKNSIPVTSQTSTNPGGASFNDGFPVATRTPVAAGGVPPSGQDMNGILNAITAIQQWQSAGGLFKFDSAFSTAIGGYPKGAILASADGLRTWRNTVEANTTDPDGASPYGWISTMGNRHSLLVVSGSYAIQACDLGIIIYVSSTAGASLILPAAVAVPI